ncbi:MAG: FAD-binding domain-containing protein [Pseudanabaenaceae cyanobacterium bins.39]|nr:FAD-binding domain-containing protein [Pseudanabaenaceae cyanobacterium bins.39]
MSEHGCNIANPLNQSTNSANSTFTALVWHRRDLRVDDHPALSQAIAQSGDAGKVIGLFIFDPDILDDGVTEGSKVDFMLGCLRELQVNYRKLGSELLFMYGQPVQCLHQLAQVIQATHVFFNEDVEPFALKRDRDARETLQSIGVKVQSFVDIGLIAPDAIATQSGEPYKVYTPFWRNWQSKPKPKAYDAPQRINGLASYDNLPTIPLPSLRDLKFINDIQLPKAGESAAIALLNQFCDGNGILRYQTGRDFPAESGTSSLSPHLRFGTVGIRRVWEAAIAAEQIARSEEEAISITTWKQELAWREFYQHVLYHFPELETGAYRQQMQHFPWENDQEKFEAWCEGRTGFPIVDAAMRQLNQTGWMHNRCRMIVASFLTKDLIINWQWGEEYFMRKLLDGDLAANNGGWQWSASSGMDPKPLRIFNPASQARKYDPEGEYILRWLPELQGLTTAELLSGNIPPHQCDRRNYPRPIVDHNIQQQKFKKLYQDCKLTTS